MAWIELIRGAASSRQLSEFKQQSKTRGWKPLPRTGMR